MVLQALPNGLPHCAASCCPRKSLSSLQRGAAQRSQSGESLQPSSISNCILMIILVLAISLPASQLAHSWELRLKGRSGQALAAAHSD